MKGIKCKLVCIINVVMGLCNRIEEDSESGAISTDATSDVIGQGLMIQYLNWSVFPPPLNLSTYLRHAYCASFLCGARAQASQNSSRKRASAAA